VIERCSEEFYFYAETALKIKAKDGAVVDFHLNRAQRFVHEALEKQLRDTGKVRALILKGRQQGISTYVQARLRWRLKHRTGCKGYVMAHEQRGSDNLFNMAEHFHLNEPDFMRPSTGAANAKELWFDKLDTRYEVATAGSKDVGRSGTAQFFHASEYAFWPNADTHWAGIGQVIPDMAGTEVIVESTANGVKNDFYARWKQAINGKGDYLAIFVPWFWQPEYTREAEGFVPTEEEAELQSLFGLTLGQLAFRRNKVESDFKGDASRFQQEYPCNWQEAFINEQRDSFIAAKAVMRAVFGAPCLAR
jgi:hypothetical protein